MIARRGSSLPRLRTIPRVAELVFWCAFLLVVALCGAGFLLALTYTLISFARG